jgi:hypothetical protein
MVTVDELLDMIDEPLETSIDELLVIDPNTRQIDLPGSELIFGVESDTNSERKYFICPRIVGNNLDLASCFIRVNYRNSNGDIDAYLVDDVAVVGDNIVFSWELHRPVTMYKGQTTFIICACRPDTKNVEWHTTQAVGLVLEGLEPDGEKIEAETADVVAQLLAVVEAQTDAVKAEGATQVLAVQNEGETVCEAIVATAEATKEATLAEIEAKGTNTLASIPDDYTALGEAVEAIGRKTAPGIVCEVEGESVYVSDASDNYVQSLRIFGKSTQDSVPSPDAPVEIESVVNPMITVNEQTLPITHTLHGIPVASGGNYTDSDGQQWICDEVDLERGVYVQRIGEKVFDGSSDEIWYSELVLDETTMFRIEIPDSDNVGNTVGKDFVCTHFPIKNMYNSDTTGTQHTMQQFYFRLAKSVMSTVDLDGFRTLLGESPMSVVYRLKTPIETPLTEAEIAAYRALHTNKPNTTVLNDAGAHMVVEYVADTKLYIDNKIATLLSGK